jgi:4-amino-4-deoxy-L-arabinose transferase-like glycosyltransferase
MLVLHDYVTPHINFIKYFEKPIFFYWVEALNIKLFGLSLWSVRLSTALMGLLGCLFTYISSRKLYGRGCGILAALVLASSFLYFIMARTITIDMTLSTLLTGSLFSFLLGSRELPGRSRDNYLWLMYIFAGLAVLTKGFVGIIFPGMIVFCWMVIHGEWRSLKTWCIPTGVLIVLAINLPWHLLVQLRNPEFFHFYFMDQQFLRYFTPYAGREQPIWFFPLVLFLGFLPWTFFLIQAIKFSWPKLKLKFERNTLENKASVFLLLWIFLIYLFFQCSHSQLMPYLLPIFPPMSVLMARYFCGMAEQRRTLGMVLGLWALGIFSLILFVGVGLVCAGIFGSLQELIPQINSFNLEISVLIFLAMTALAIFSYKNKGIAHVALVLVLGMGCFCISILMNRTAFELNSTQPLAAQINQLYKPGDKIFDYLDYN